ncbi:hypothetical protein, partial [Streptomyces sp. JWR5-1]|uniref:hypothetical protein n=1 Tax=Streptomyces sp. JWR5-1 TaxID=3122053 RepID=UPI003018C1CA
VVGPGLRSCPSRAQLKEDHTCMSRHASDQVRSSDRSGLKVGASSAEEHPVLYSDAVDGGRRCEGGMTGQPVWRREFPFFPVLTHI